MFFYLYAIIELIAFFLDSNIIPTANGSYQVSQGTVLYRTFLINVRMFPVVVRGIIYRPGRGRLLLPSHQWVCGLSVCRGWHTVIIMGVLSLSSVMSGELKPPRIAVFTDLLSYCLWGRVFHRHCDLQGLCRIQKYASSRTVDCLHSLAFDLRSHLHRLATDSGLPYTGRPVAHW